MNNILKLILLSKKRFIFYCILSLILSSFLSLINPLILKYIIDDVLFQYNLDYIPFIILLLLGLLLCETIFSFFNNYSINIIIETSEKEFKIEFYKKFSNIRYNDFINQNYEEYINNYIIDIKNIFIFFSECLKFIINTFSSIIFIMLILFYYNTKLALVSLSFLPPYFLILFFSRYYIFNKYDEIRDLTGYENIKIKNFLESLIIIRLFNSFNYFINNTIKMLNSLVFKNIKINIIENIIISSLNILSMISPILIITMGVKLIYSNEITIGILIVFYTYIFKLIPLINQSVYFYYFCQKAIISFKKIKNIFDCNNMSVGNKTINNIIYNSIIVNNIKIIKNDKIILNNISFDIHNSDKICIFGENGSGKTTLLNVISGLLEISAGNIIIDNININNIDKIYHFNNISYFTQDCYLINDTIINNITMGKDYNISNVIEVCKRLEIYDFINSLNNSFDYLITGNGESFSGGERKLICFARILLQKPKLILLDEFSNDLDNKHKIIINNILKEDFNNSIIIFVSHNIDDMLLAKKFICLKDGQVLEIFNDNIMENICKYIK